MLSSWKLFAIMEGTESTFSGGFVVSRTLSIVTLLFVFFVMTGCSNGAYSYEEAVKRGDIVYQVDVENVSRFEEFLNNVSNITEDTIRITGYTHEGDPIFEDLHFDGKVIHYTHDNSYDEFGGSDRGITEGVCKEIHNRVNELGDTEYWLSGCSNGDDRWLITIEK